MATARLTSELRPHPVNSKLYENFDEASHSFKQLKESIVENGILQPLVVRPDGTVLSGHRRLAVARHLGIELVPVADAPEGDDRQLIIEYNRYRHKTTGELMREAEMLEAIIKEKAHANKLLTGAAGRAGGTGIPVEDRIHTGAHVSAAIGMKPRTYAKLRDIWEKAKTNENAKDKVARIDRGEMSIDAAHKSLRSLMDTHVDSDVPEFIRFFNSWQFSENDPRFGIPHPGRIPGQIAGNILYYYTEPGAVVVDPMAGGGSTLDVAEFMGRECLAYDVKPMRPDIQQHDISKGFPDEAHGADLIFMDPPYWNMKDEGYGDDSSSRMSLDDFMAWYFDLLHNAARTIRVGGFVAVIIMGQYFRLPSDFTAGYIDWPVLAYNYMVDAGLIPWARIGVTFPPSMFGGFDVEKSKAGKYLLPNMGDIVVMRRP